MIGALEGDRNRVDHNLIGERSNAVIILTGRRYIWINFPLLNFAHLFRVELRLSFVTTLSVVHNGNGSKTKSPPNHLRLNATDEKQEDFDILLYGSVADQSFLS